MEILQTLLTRLGNQDQAAFEAENPTWCLVQVDRQESGGAADTTDVTHKLDAQELRRQAGGAREALVCRVPASGTLLIGRAEGVGLLLTEGGISKRHAELRWEGERLLLTDLGSTNGTYVNRRKLEPQSPLALKSDDQVRFGYGQTFQLMSPAGLFRYLEVLRRFGV